MKKSIILVSVSFMILISSGFLVRSQQTGFSDKAENAIYILQVEYEVETNMLKNNLDDYSELSSERGVIRDKLSGLYSDMDSLLKKDTVPSLSTVELKEAEIEDAEDSRISNAEKIKLCLGKIKDNYSKLILLDRKIADLKGTLPSEEDTVTGKWDVTLLPGGDKGIFVLKQSGTIVTGQYQLEGGWNGSIQGTLVDRKVYLQKIDSKLGRSGEYDGFLSHDGKTIRGTWMDYDVGSGYTNSGSWAATRREG